MENILLGGIAVIIILLLVLLTILLRRSDNTPLIRQEIHLQLTGVKQDLTNIVQALNSSNMQTLKQLGQLMQHNQKLSADSQKQHLAAMEVQLQTRLTEFHKLLQTQHEQLELIRSSLTNGMQEMRRENNQQLEAIRGTVDEKLQTTLEKRISESFKTVSTQLEQVYKGLGEMQSLAGDVGGLKKVLAGVKTRGILGEVQLGAILEEILAPEQYEANVITVPGSRNPVEYAVKLPHGDGKVYLPIDAKFPGERYTQLLDALENGDKVAVDAAYQALETVIKSEAKDIHEKYIAVPYTTSFGIMFLPFEGLYAEVVNRGLVEILQRDYQINVAGPSTMAALLNSLQMGFKTLAIQQRSNEAWEVLGAVKTEFGKFATALYKMQGHLNQTSEDLENLINTRTNMMNRRLKAVEELEPEQAQRILQREK